MSARRPLLTALGATTLLAALWFVPSAGATAPGHPAGASAAPAGANTTGTAPAASGPASGSGPDTGAGTEPRTAAQAAPAPLSLADTGSVDTTPYVLGGTLCLFLGAGSVAFSVRRSHAR
ncbi:hypothetical protein [Streptomyces sp. NBC_01408]|uniref:hypothetical protein n=1 Tax=Streptomyces sp. NBC_01408 TaxID=2903855 RepID=UPI00224E7918|nr:hypothetical protein [Streptomyces sp. NBC_01408]MCX4691365.1 hypothetical protein [Streptomyces sp. NBC_01408]